MATATDNFYAKINRPNFKYIKEIGAMPFLLFQYYQTYSTAPEITPTLKTIADDLGLEPNAVCNLRSRLEKAGWIRYENGRVFLLKSFTPCEPDSHHVNGNDATFTPCEESFTPCESHIRKENEQEKEQKEKKRGTEPKTRIPFNFTLTEKMHEWAKINVPEIDIVAATEDFYEYWSNLEGKKAQKSDWFLTWKKGMRLQLKWQKEKGDAIGKINSGQGTKRKSNADIFDSYGYYGAARS